MLTAIKLLVGICVIILLPFWFFSLQAFNIQYAGQAKSKEVSNDIKPNTIIILGAGVQNGQPSKVLQLRLDAAIKLYNSQRTAESSTKIKGILVSGDNRDIYYDEPAVMKKYLVNQGIPAGIIQEDSLGIRTLDSCSRAYSIYNIKSAYLVSQAYHLPRATFLCRNQNLQVIPVTAEDSCSPIICSLLIREIGASWLAVLNLFGFSLESA